MLGILFGIAFIFHQVGSFISSNVAGQIVEKTHSYDLLWSIDIILCIVASLSVYALNRNQEPRKEDRQFSGTIAPIHS